MKKYSILLLFIFISAVAIVIFLANRNSKEINIRDITHTQNEKEIISNNKDIRDLVFNEYNGTRSIKATKLNNKKLLNVETISIEDMEKWSDGEPKWKFVSTILPRTKLKEENYINFFECAGCHGTRAGKKAFGKTRALVDMSSLDLKTTLMDYKNKNLNKYGYGNIMYESMSKYSEKDIYSLVVFIESLKK